MSVPSFTIRNGVLSMGSKRVRLDHVSTWELGTNHIIITVHGRQETIQAGQESKLIAEAMDGYFSAVLPPEPLYRNPDTGAIMTRAEVDIDTARRIQDARKNQQQ